MPLNNLYKEFIEDFDNKKIKFVIITALGRSGSLLLQSFFDSHEQILMIPTILPIYQNWPNEPDENIDYISFTNIFFNSDIFKMDWFINKLGKDREYKLDLKLDLLKNKTLEILKIIKFSRKNFILALHIAYAEIFDIDINKIKVIVLHEHYLGPINIPTKLIRTEAVTAYTNYIFSNNSNLFEKAKKDFNDIKFIFTIRNLYDSFISFINLMRSDSLIIKSDRFWTHIYYLLIVFRDINEIISKNESLKSEDYIFIEFEKIHLETRKIMENISNIINIEYKDSLLESTIQNQIWWGNSPKKLFNGITKERNFDEWKENLTQIEIDLLSFTFGDLPNKFNYDLLSKSNKTFDEVYYLSEKEFEGHIFNLFLYSNTSNIEDFFNVKGYLWIEIYPLLRKKLFSFIKDPHLNMKLNNDISYKGVNFCIQYKFDTSNLLSDGYLICFQPWLYTSITSQQLDYLNTFVDQVWVPSNFTRANYIKSGVIPNKIKVINYGIDVEKSNATSSSLDHYFMNDSFKFLYQGDLKDKSLIDNIFLAFNQAFNNNEKISLILLNSEYLDPYMKKEREIFEEVSTNIIINKNIEVKVFFDYLNISYLDKIYKNFDCFIYPYNKESIGMPILRALNNETPIITTGEGISKEILSQNNSYLINSTFEETNMTKFNNISLANNHEKIKIDIKHFKNLIRDVYENRDEAKNKAKQAKNIVLDKYNWSNTMTQVNKAIQELKSKPILRYHLNELKKDIENEANSSFKEKDYHKSLDLYYELSKYDRVNINYLYNLGRCYFELSQYEEALDCFTNVLENNLPNFELLNYISITLYKLGDYEDSNLYKEEALKLK